MKKIKCQYCGRKYTPANERDCCPACGAFNEIADHSYGNVNTNTTVIQPKKKNWVLIGVLSVISMPFICFAGIFFIAFFQALFGIDEGNDYDRDYGSDYEIIVDSDYDIPESQLEILNVGNDSYVIATGGELDWSSIDYDKEYILTGSYDEMAEIADMMSKTQFSWLDTTISLNGKVTKNGATIYIDSINLSWYGSDNLELMMEIESNGKGTTPEEVEVYLVKKDTRDRVKGSSYGLTYKDNVEKVEDLFTNEVSSTSYWSSSISNFVKYDTLEFIVDGETFSFPLNYSDEKTEIVFYGLK